MGWGNPQGSVGIDLANGLLTPEVNVWEFLSLSEWF
jgi:hypothetical protein